MIMSRTFKSTQRPNTSNSLNDFLSTEDHVLWTLTLIRTVKVLSLFLFNVIGQYITVGSQAVGQRHLFLCVLLLWFPGSLLLSSQHPPFWLDLCFVSVSGGGFVFGMPGVVHCGGVLLQFWCSGCVFQCFPCQVCLPLVCCLASLAVSVSMIVLQFHLVVIIFSPWVVFKWFALFIQFIVFIVFLLCALQEFPPCFMVFGLFPVFLCGILLSNWTFHKLHLLDCYVSLFCKFLSLV